MPGGVDDINAITEDGSDYEAICSPEELRMKAKDVEVDVVPIRSREQYEKEYEKFCDWRITSGTSVSYVSDTIVTAYYKDM